MTLFFYQHQQQQSAHHLGSSLYNILGSSLLYYTMYYIIHHILEKRATQMLCGLRSISFINYITFILPAAAVCNNYIILYFVERKKEGYSF